MPRFTRRDKELPEPSALARRSVIVPQTQVQQQPGLFDPSLGIFFLAQKNDGFQPWGIAPTYRDRQLRQFLGGAETFLHGAMATVIATNMGLSWVLDGPPGLVQRASDVLHSADWGDGWEGWVGRESADFYGQDKGAVAELVRDFDDPRAPVVGLNHLDAIRCWHTGNPETPIIYTDRQGKLHGLPWYSVFTLNEIPAPHETLYGLQYSALTRVMSICQIIRNTMILVDEKTGGRHTRTVHVVSGVKQDAIQNAMTMAQGAADQAGLLRYIQPVIVTTLDPKAEPKMIELKLADLPDGFSENLDTWFKWFMVAISMGFLRDYQDFAPLPGGGLGTSNQSNILHMKARGKGPAIWQKRTEHRINNTGLLPAGVTFRYDESDIEEEQSRATIFATYASAYKALTDAAIMDREADRQHMVENRLISQDMADQLNQRNPQPEPQPSPFGAPDQGQGRQNPDVSAMDNPDSGRQRGQRDSAVAERGMTMELDPERTIEEDRLTGTARRALGSFGRDVRKRLSRKQFAGVDVPGSRQVIINVEPPDMTPVTDAIVEGMREVLEDLPVPEIHVASPEVNVAPTPPATVNVEAPIVNIPAPIVNLPAPVVNVAPTPPAAVTVEARKERREVKRTPVYNTAGDPMSGIKEVLIEYEG